MVAQCCRVPPHPTPIQSRFFTFVFSPQERVKSLARTENTVTKIYASTATVSPMFVFYTSNERLFKHAVSAALSGTCLPRTFLSQADDASQGGKKPRVSPENLEAVRARFLEMFVFKAPKQDKSDLESGCPFVREDFILAMTDRAIETLEKYRPSDFHSAHLPAYVVSALVKNVDFFERVMCNGADNEESTAIDECPQNHRLRIQRLREKYNVNIGC